MVNRWDFIFFIKECGGKGKNPRAGICGSQKIFQVKTNPHLCRKERCAHN
jgi:hypothetical protein